LGFVAPGIEARYSTGAVQATQYSRTWIAGEQGWGWFNKDQAALGVSPYIRLTMGNIPEVWIGYNVNIDLSKDVTPDTAVGRDGDKKDPTFYKKSRFDPDPGMSNNYTIKHLFYIAVKISL
jgi:hypothetical protein